MISTGLRDATFRWIADDVDEGAKAELQAVLAKALAGDQAAAVEVADRMTGPLTFGTAGLRAPVRAGSQGMNRAVVVRTTAGVAEWLTAHGHAGGVVVVGRDARHGSETFATDTAEVLAAAGFRVRLLPEPLPTPVLAFAVRSLHAVAGVQITASHNPPADNGYKLYDGSGAQIISPADQEIEAAIERAPAAFSVPRSAAGITVEDRVLETYLDRVAALVRAPVGDLRVALTPMHGVGGAIAVQALRRAGFTDVHVVRSQAAPDPDFPTVAFPNPEEPGATDQLLELATAVEADLSVALDPDADRCALGIPDGAGGFRMLSGDETGVLLGAQLLSTLDRAAHPDPLIATTIVSSSLLGSLAAAHGVRYAETLTGFKWLVRAGDDGQGLVYAYEEALGHCVDPEAVRDKDGLSAAVVACVLAARLKAEGRSMQDLLDSLAVEHGVHLTAQVSLRVESLARIAELMAGLRADPPTVLAETEVVTEDLLPRADVLRVTGAGIRLLVRPSGTEPKLKAYLQVVEPVATGMTVEQARTTAQHRLEALRAAVTTLLVRE